MFGNTVIRYENSNFTTAADKQTLVNSRVFVDQYINAELIYLSTWGNFVKTVSLWDPWSNRLSVNYFKDMLDNYIEFHPDKSNVPGDEYIAAFGIFIVWLSNSIIDQSRQAELKQKQC